MSNLQTSVADDREAEPHVDNKRSLDLNGPERKRLRASRPETNDEPNRTSSTNRKPESDGRSLPTRQRHLKTSTLYISGLHPRVTRLHLEKMMQKYGTIKRLHTKETPTTYYAFCEFVSIESAQRAMENLDGASLLQKRLIVRPAQDHSNREHSSISQHSQQSHQKADALASPHRNIDNQRQQLEDKIALLKRKIREKDTHH